MAYAANAFNEKFNVNVKFTFKDVAPMSSPGRLIQDGGTTRVGDIVDVAHDTLGNLVIAGVLMENLVNAERIKTDFMDSAEAAVTVESKIYGFPVGILTTALFYNKDLFPQQPKSFEEILTFSESFNDKKKNKYALVWDIQNYYESRMFVSLYGGYEFGNNGTNSKDIGIASENAQKGLTALKNVYNSLKFNPSDMRNPQVRRGLFSEGNIAALIDGPWATKQYLDMGINVGITPMPTYDGKHPRTFATVSTIVVPVYTQYPMAAQLFAKFLTSDTMLKKRFEMTTYLPPISSVLKELKVNADPITKAFIEQVNYADAMPSIPEMGFIWSPMASAINSLIVNDKSAEEVSKQALTIINEQISLQE